jgi:hypothetical protein
LRAGYLALRRIAGAYGVRFDPDPAPTDPISITRGEFDQVLAQLAEIGVLLKSDRDQAWRDFAGWRVNHDTGAAGAVRAAHGPVVPLVV